MQRVTTSVVIRTLVKKINLEKCVVSQSAAYWVMLADHDVSRALVEHLTSEHLIPQYSAVPTTGPTETTAL